MEKLGGLPAWLSSENAIFDKQSWRPTERQINDSSSHLTSFLGPILLPSDARWPSEWEQGPLAQGIFVVTS